MGDSNCVQEFCCTCLKQYGTKDKLISLNYVPTEDISYKFKLKSCVPEMALENSENCFLCTLCRTALETAYTFRSMCLLNGGKLEEFKNNYNTSVEISKRSQNVRIKQELIEQVCYEEVPEEDYEIYFSEVNELPKAIELKIFKDKPETDPLECVDNTPEDIQQSIVQKQTKDLRNKFNPFESEVELLRVDNGVKEKITTLPQISARRTSALIAQKLLEDAPPANKTITPKVLTDIEIIEIACKTIPGLLAYNCTVRSLECKVSVERLNLLNLPKSSPKKYLKKKLTKKQKKKYNKSKKDINYWCHICVKFIAIGRKHRYTAHMLNHKNIKAYKCDKCSKAFTYGETLSKHKKECNGIAPIPQQTFQILPSIKIKTENNVKVIQKSRPKIDIKKIKKEPYDVDNDWTEESPARKYLKVEPSTSEGDTARRSLRAKTVNKPTVNLSSDAYHCEICEYQTYKKHQYQVHMMKHFNDRRFECSKCPKKFFENWELNRHLRTVHLSSVINKRPPPHSYDIQNIKPLLASKTNISDHTDDTNDSESAVFVKMLEPSVSLTVANETVVTPVIQSIESLADDISANGAISFACKICNLSFKSHSLLISHSQSHKMKRQCNFCGQSFVSNSAFLEHVKSHSNNYNISDRVETHVPPKLPPKKKKKKKFFCTICNLEFASKDHANIHTGAKPYDCKVCGKEFAAYSTLRKHRWTHLDEPRNNVEDFDQFEGLQRLKYTCEICSKTFMNKWQINSHTCHSATGETVYRCQICKNAFVGRTALIEHMGIHVNQTGDFYQ